jgi:hypothetical protein
MTYRIVLVSKGYEDSYAAGDPTVGRGANEFTTHKEALAAIRALPDAHWAVRENKS